jgi:hypothetical protein
MKAIQPLETELVGQWIQTESGVSGNEILERINWLIANHLRKVGYSKLYGAWETLYQDPQDGRYWVRSYPNSEMHGGGPATLKCISEDEAKLSFRFE